MDTFVPNRRLFLLALWILALNQYSSITMITIIPKEGFLMAARTCGLQGQPTMIAVFPAFPYGASTSWTSQGP